MKTIYFIPNISLLLCLLIQQTMAQNSPYPIADHILGGMTCVMVTHEVNDFETWKTGYDNDLGRRKELGLHEKLFLRDAGNSNSITVIFEVSDLDKTRQFFNDPHLAEIMKKAGVISKPEITYFKVSNSGIPMKDAFLLVKHKVEDYTVWRKAYDDHKKVRSEYGLTLTALGRDTDDPSNIIVLFNNGKTENIVAFLEKSDLKEAMKNAGVIGEPNISVLQVY